jgi:hypothetical protein
LLLDCIGAARGLTNRVRESVQNSMLMPWRDLGRQTKSRIGLTLPGRDNF